MHNYYSFKLTGRRKNFARSLCLITLAVFCFSAGFTEIGAEPVKQWIMPFKTNKKITVDGKLDEKSWKEAPWHTGFVKLGSKKSAEQQTSFSVLYTEKTLYIGIKCYETKLAALRCNANKYDQGLWGDDSVEIFLEAGKAVYRLAANAVGTQWDSSSLNDADQTGFISNFYWKCQAGRSSDYWSLEIAVPFYSLCLKQAAPTPWLMNICRNRIAEARESSSWYPIPQYKPFKYRGSFRPFKGMDMDFSPYCYDFNDPTASIKMNRGILETTVNFNFTNHTGKNQDLRLEGWLLGSDGAAKIKDQKKHLHPDEAAKIKLGEFRLEQPGNYKFVLNCFDAKTSVLYYQREQILNISYSPLIMKIICPSYKNSIFPTQKIDTVRLAITANTDQKILADSQVEVLFTDSSNLQIERKMVPPPIAPTLTVDFNVKDLKAGKYFFTANLYNAKSELTGTVKSCLRKLSATKGSELRIDKNGNLVINGKPGIARFYYGGNLTSAQLGCNFNHYSDIMYMDKSNKRAYLDQLAKHNLFLSAYPYQKGSAILKSQTAHLTPALIKEIRTTVNELKDHPAMGLWFLVDEPDCDMGWPPSLIEEIYDLVSEIDPYHPCWLINKAAYRKYKYGTDIFSPDPYPGFDGQKQFIYESVPAGKGIARHIERGKLETQDTHQAIWLCAQAFCRSTRVPTYWEQRYMNYLALIHGVKGFCYYAFDYTLAYPESKLGIPQVIREIKHLEPILTSQDEATCKISDSSIHCLCKKYQRHFYLFAVNTSNEIKNVFMVPVGLQNENTMQVLFENRSIPLKDRKIIMDKFAPWEVHVYTTSKDTHSADITPIPIFQARLDKIQAERCKDGNLCYMGEKSYGTGPTASASSTFRWNLSPRMAIDGLTDMNPRIPWHAWQDSTRNQFPDWLDVKFRKKVQISRVIVYSENLRDFKIQYRNNDNWIDAAKITNNTKKVMQVTFPSFTTDAIRLWITAVVGPYSSVTEIEAYAK